MHIGGLRTALFSFLLAKRTGGQFILRIEDTDQKRFVPGAQERLCGDLQWAGLQWDEGPIVGGECGPYQQSQRTEIYQRHAKALLDSGAAYRCFCTPQTASAGSSAYVTSGCYQDCASASPDESRPRSGANDSRFTVRLKRPANVHTRQYPDLVYGSIKRLKRTPTASQSGDDEGALDAADTILIKMDGSPTYHFANVVDDHLMRITHVIRGTEWMASTPLHYDLYDAFGWEPPLFAHVGLLLDKAKAKLSKRNADLALDVRGLRDDHGVLPETLCNFLALQGWSNPQQNDVMDMAELIQNFDLKFTTGNTMIGMEKLWFLQRKHVERRCGLSLESRDYHPIQSITERISIALQREYPRLVNRLGSADALTAYCSSILLADRKSYTNASDFVERNWYFFDLDGPREPPAQEFYDADKTISFNDVRGLVVDIFEHDELGITPSQNAESNLPADFSQLDERNAKIHDMITRRIWLHVVGMSSDSPAGATMDLNIGQGEIAKRSASSDEAAASLLNQFKAWQKATMRYLRERLCFGTPGVAIGLVVAILGDEECRRRLAM